MPRTLSTDLEGLQQIARMGELHLLPNAVNRTAPILEMILHPESGELCKRVADWHCTGAHHETAKRVNRHLEGQGITQAETADKLNQSPATRSRRETDDSGSAKEVASELADLAPLLQECPVPTWVDLFEGAYCAAITWLRQTYRESQGSSLGPRFLKEDFAFVWQMNRTLAWETAKQAERALREKRKQEEKQQVAAGIVETPAGIEERNRLHQKQDADLAELFSTAAGIVHANVQKDFPCHPNAKLREAPDLETLHANWGIYFLIVLLARAPIETRE